ncbi:nuclear envelope phosphatase-regulatory subunit 1 isoform X1 [Mus caroli]|uniref:Nuclear envelope phosphatase-regulatory subunit 1 n=1 Tax=Mus caroli TaxID=10089 RepID=A0A6P5QEB2_MUSCR|nr:nuclear envelope phosphatase-regulatory subunit 1 isoform X1 [Mus caroli]
MNSLEQAEDLKAFERRLTEYIHCLQPATGRWRMLLIVVSVCTATGAWNWLIDPETQKVSFFTSLWNHPFFTISCITLIGLFFAGIHKRVVAPSMYPFPRVEFFIITKLKNLPWFLSGVRSYVLITSHPCGFNT